MSLRNYCIVIFIIGIHIVLKAQNYERILNFPPVNGPAGAYKNIFSGGFNNIEHQFIDIDADNDFDLLYLNSDGTFGFLENTGSSQSPEFTYSLTNISGLFFSDWFFLVDLDNDNDYDLVSGKDDFIEYRKNVGTSTSPLFIIDRDTLKDNLGQPIFSEFGSNPVLADIDNDGDYDFFTGNSAGTVTFYENIGNPNSFNFEFKTNFWQNILIVGTNANDGNRHGASSLEFTDLDGDNDLDLLWGDFFSNSLYLLENQGNVANPQMELVSNVYPVNSDSVNTSGFNMPRTCDIDNDSDPDLFVTVLYDPTVPQNLFYYENLGTPFNPNFNKVTEDLLYTLDVGNNSHPVFIDIDNDNDQDLFIGALNNPNGSIYFFENYGSANNPSFNFVTNIFSGITGDLSIVPAFGDLDNDGDFDLLTGRFDGKIGFYINNGSATIPNFNFIGFLQDNSPSQIDVGTSSTPLLTDFDNDGDLDLVIGAFNGRLIFYRNIGTPQVYNFELVNNFFQSIDVGDNSTPTITDFDDDGRNDLFTGNRDGFIFYYRNIGTNTIPVWQLNNLPLPDEDFGGYSMISFSDFDGDSDNDFFIGNVKGGLYLYRNNTVNSINKGEYEKKDYVLFNAFPNPFNPYTNLVVDLNESEFVTIDVYNILGEKLDNIFSGYLSFGKHHFIWNGINNNSNYSSSATYLIVASTPKQTVTLKVILLK